MRLRSSLAGADMGFKFMGRRMRGAEGVDERGAEGSGGVGSLWRRCQPSQLVWGLGRSKPLSEKFL